MCLKSTHELIDLISSNVWVALYCSLPWCAALDLPVISLRGFKAQGFRDWNHFASPGNLYHSDFFNLPIFFISPDN